jgi:hypothetical protein
MSSLDNLLSEEISDETAVIVSNLLFEMFWVWQCSHGDQIERHHQPASPSIVHPQPPWEGTPPGADEESAPLDDELPF